MVNNTGSASSQVLKFPERRGADQCDAGCWSSGARHVPNAAGGLVPSSTGVVINQNVGTGGAVVAVSTLDGSTSTVATTNTNSSYLAVAQTPSGTVSTLTSSSSAVVQTTQASAVNFGLVSVTQTQSATVTFNLGTSERHWQLARR